jgi:elongation factor Ts
MAEIKASDVKALREKTGAGMMDCKKALEQAQGDFAKAEKILKEMGLAAVEKRVGRATNEGKVFIKVSGGQAVLLELSCETDFVARNADFNELGARLLDVILERQPTSIDEGLQAMVTEAASKIKENMSLRRFELVKAAPGDVLHEYVHGDKLCVLVRLSASDPAALGKDAVKAFVHDLALHVAAFSPAFLSQDKVPAEWLKEQEEIFLKQMSQDEKLKGKPAQVLDGIVKGKVKKLMAEMCLLDQPFIRDEKVSVSAIAAKVGKEAGSEIKVVDFRYYKVGQ